MLAKLESPDISSAEIEQLLDKARQVPCVLYNTTNLVKDDPVEQDRAISIFLIDESKYSSLRRLLRVTAHCLRERSGVNVLQRY